MPQAISPSRPPSFALVLLLGWLFVALELLVLYWAGTAETLLDTDDAMRLVQARAFLAHNGWFDLTEMRVAPSGYESHWSRLIDAGLAGLFLLFRPFTDVDLAERLMRTVWPLLWLMAAMGGACAIGWRMAGRDAALAVLVLALGGLPALQQFKPGSIDHHNVQIALAVLTTAATVWSDRRGWTACPAGALTGLALAIGLEGLPYLVVCGAAFAARFIIDPEGANALRAYGLSLAAASAAAFFVTVGPDHWGRTLCDAIAINSAAPVVLGGLLLAASTHLLPGRGVAPRCAAIAATGATVLAAFIALEPRCLAGPFAMMDPAVRPIWLAHVQEMQPLVHFAHDMPVRAAAIAVFPLAALVACWVLAADARLRRDFGFLVTSAVFAVGAVTTIAAIKGYNYPMWLGMPLVAALALRLCGVFHVKTLPARLVASLLLGPVVLSALAIGLAQAATPRQVGAAPARDRSACFRTASYAPLARLPAGLVVADIDFGPFLLALTPHSVLAAPYHRLSTGLIIVHAAFSAPPEEARRILSRVQANYVVLCGSDAPAGLAHGGSAASLRSRLEAGAIPDWLKPLPQAQRRAFLVFRVNP